jgi:hypothetical protein
MSKLTYCPTCGIKSSAPKTDGRLGRFVTREEVEAFLVKYHEAVWDGAVDDYTAYDEAGRDLAKEFLDGIVPRAVMEAREEYPECSGDPASCPENEGFGCCKPNPTARTDSELLDWLEMQLVEVRTPLRYGSKADFLSAPTLADDGGEEDQPSDLRSKIRERLNGAKT